MAKPSVREFAASLNRKLDTVIGFVWSSQKLTVADVSVTEYPIHNRPYQVVGGSASRRSPCDTALPGPETFRYGNDPTDVDAIVISRSFGDESASGSEPSNL